jgi:cyclophilin family peptidyl-prolyl cis-trans isomerase
MNRSVLILALAAVLPLPCTSTRAQPAEDGLYAGVATTIGEFWCRLAFQNAPRTVANFVSLAEGSRDWIDFRTASIVRRPFYDGLTFHRVVEGFVIQAGSPNGRGTDGPGYQFADEFHPGLRHALPGILSMANSGPDSNGSQFFVTVTNTPFLDDRHSVFGEVIQGMDVVHAISKVPTNINSQPLTPVVINQIRIMRRGAEAEAFDPAAVSPPLPSVGIVPFAIETTGTNLTYMGMNLTRMGTNVTIHLQARSNHFQHLLLSSDLEAWSAQSFRGPVTNINADNLRFTPAWFLRAMEGAYEP